MTAERTRLFASVALLATAACWGSTFFLIHDLLVRVPVIDFLAIRFTIAAVAMLLVAPQAVRRLGRDKVRHAVILGGIYGVAQIVQTAGLAKTPASVSGFITGMYVVCTPLLGALLLHSRIVPMTWLAVVLAIGGLGVLTLGGVSFGYGEALTLVSAVLYALHIVGLGEWSTARDAVGMSIVQMVVIAVICLIGAAPGGIILPNRLGDWLSILYMALFAGALALLAQTWAQSHLPPTPSAIIMSMEPVFAALFAVVFGSESATSRMILGGSLVVAAMLLVEILPRHKVEAEVPHIAV